MPNFKVWKKLCSRCKVDPSCHQWRHITVFWMKSLDEILRSRTFGKSVVTLSMHKSNSVTLYAPVIVMSKHQPSVRLSAQTVTQHHTCL